MGERYSDLVGRFHLYKEAIKDKWNTVKEDGGLKNSLQKRTEELKDVTIQKINRGDEEYDHLYRCSVTTEKFMKFHGTTLPEGLFHCRRKSRWELTRISAAVMGIEFSYAAETAFVSPTLLKIGEKIVPYFLSPPSPANMCDQAFSEIGKISSNLGLISTEICQRDCLSPPAILPIVKWF